MSGTLVTDPEEVASALESLFANGTPPRAVGIHVPEGHTLTAADVAVIDRAMIRLEPCSSP
jgi:hypothetical protein